MQFNFNYSASTTAAPQLQALQNVLTAVGNYYASILTDPITLNIQIGWGETNGASIGAGTLATASVGTFGGFSYAAVRNALINDAVGPLDAAVVAGLSVAAPAGFSTVFLARASQKALGLLSGAASGVDGYIGFSTTANFDYDNSNGVTSSAYDLFAVAFHEIGHVMGRTFLFDSGGNNTLADLFHYDASGGRSAALGGYFAYDNTAGGRIAPLQANNGIGSASDFSDAAAANDPYLYHGTQGAKFNPTEADFRLNDVLGFNWAGNAVIPSKTATADFNGDNRSDILWQNNNGALSAFLMNGGSISQNLNAGTTPTNGLLQSRSNDFNGDGRDDILWRDASTGAVSTWLMNGSNILSNQPVAAISNSYRLQGVADFDGDGKADVVWRHANGDVALWTMDGAPITSNTTMPAIDNNWKYQATGDFNGDGKADILWRHLSGQVVFWGMNGSTIQTNQALQAQIDLSWHVAGAGDFNGDGKTDIVWRHNTGFVSLWEMNGPAILTNTAIADVSNNWVIKTIGDFDGDGKSDLLWQDTGSGFVSIWQMNGSAIASNIGVVTMTNDWHVAGYSLPAADFV